MKNKKIKLFLTSIFALSLALSVGAFALSKEPLSVSASSLVFEGEEEEETPEVISAPDTTEEVDEEDPKDEGTSNDETPADSDHAPTSDATEGEDETTPVSEETLNGDETSSTPTVTGKPSVGEIFGVLKNAFVDAWKDLVAHIKKWLKLS